MSEQKFYFCEKCGNLAGKVIDSGVPLVCCGEEMIELVANTVDASKEKHVPVVEVDGNIVSVKVGSDPHPMVPVHYIPFIYLQTDKGGQRKNLKPGDEPAVKFAICKDEKPLAVFEYCNLHGLWKTVL